MAISFNGTDQYLQVDTRLLGAAASADFTTACWFKANTGAAIGILTDNADKDVALYQHWMAYDSALGLYTVAREGSTARTAYTTTNPSENVWHHGCVTSSGSSPRTVYLDAGSSAQSTHNVAKTNIDRFTIGRTGDSTPSGYFDGLIAEVAQWDAVLTADEIRLLADGVSPLRIRPNALVSYFPMYDAHDLDDRVGRRIKYVQAFGSPTTSRDHPPMLDRLRRDITFKLEPVVVPPVGPTTGYVEHYYKHFLMGGI